MFDWNDEEITNIIWGEARESDDHIVPYPDGSEEKPSGLYGDQTGKESNEGAEHVKPAEHKKPVDDTDLHGAKLESCSQYEGNESRPAKGRHTESWLDISLSNVTKTDHETIRTEASNNLTETSKLDSSMHGETAEFSNCSEIFENQQEREGGDFVDYGWANIGSFDDLDRIFSNDGPMFGHANLSDEDQLWSPSKDLTGSPEKSQASFDSPSMSVAALRSTSDQFETKSEYIQPQDHLPVSGFGNLNNISSNTLQNLQAVGYTGGKATHLQKEKTVLEVSGKIPAFNSQLRAGTPAVPDEFTDKGNRQKRLLKARVKSEQKSEVRELQDICSTWSSGNQFQQFDNQYAAIMGQHYSPVLMSHQRQLPGSESSQYNHLPGPLLASPIYATMASQYPPMTVFSQLHPGEGNHQILNLGYEVSPGNSDLLNKLLDAPTKPLMMTPQEKIEKLRRRQQMRAMLAIQKQQQQLHNHVSTEHPIMEGAKSEEGNLNILPALNPNSPVEQDDSSTGRLPTDDYSAQDYILYQLQDIIGKMDIRIRLCIRDSLFRLAQSTKQRKYASDTTSSNRGTRDEVFNKEDSYSHNRFGRMPDVETETNPIDRTVAHLLFHRPLVSSGKNSERPESPLSDTKHHVERKEGASMSLSGTFNPQSYGTKHMPSHDESQVSLLFPECDQSKGSLCLNSTENASNNEAASDGAAALGIETSR